MRPAGGRQNAPGRHHTDRQVGSYFSSHGAERNRVSICPILVEIGVNLSFSQSIEICREIDLCKNDNLMITNHLTEVDL